MNLDVVVPFFNEEECVEEFCKNLMKEMDKIAGVEYKYYFIDDGSEDNTLELLKKISNDDKRINVIALLGNHGHQRALIAGLDACNGDTVLMMDGDGQHPIKVAKEMVQLAINKNEIAIFQAVRANSQGGIFKEWSSCLFYQIINLLIPELHLEKGASDFRIMRKEVVDILKAFPDRYRNLRMLLSLLKFPQISVPYKPAQRMGGKSKYNWKKMVKLASDGIFTFSYLPTRISIFLMIGTGMLGLCYAIYGITAYLQGRVLPGWTSMTALVGLVASAIFAVLAIIAQYIRRIYEEVQKHPVYIRKPDFRGEKNNHQYFED